MTTTEEKVSTTRDLIHAAIASLEDEMRGNTLMTLTCADAMVKLHDALILLNDVQYEVAAMTPPAGAQP